VHPEAVLVVHMGFVNFCVVGSIKGLMRPPFCSIGREVLKAPSRITAEVVEILTGHWLQIPGRRSVPFHVSRWKDVVLESLPALLIS
jgi:hypothetical protein